MEETEQKHFIFVFNF